MDTLKLNTVIGDTTSHTFFEHRKVPKDLAALLLYYDGGITDCKEKSLSKRKLQKRHPKVQKEP
jgi:hypothetical protein